MKISKHMAVSLGIGISCFIFPLLLLLIKPSQVWVGFAGCTAFYASGAGKSGAIKGLLAALSGVAWAMALILLTGLVPLGSEHVVMIILGAFATGFIAFAMTYQAKVAVLSIVPAAFIGCFTTFGTGGDWKLMLICIPLGILLGCFCQLCGEWLYKKFGDGKE